jgi:hypothetical protein
LVITISAASHSAVIVYQLHLRHAVSNRQQPKVLMMTNSFVTLLSKRSTRILSSLLLATVLIGTFAMLPHLSFYYGTLPWHKYPIRLQDTPQHVGLPQGAQSPHTLANLLAETTPIQASPYAEVKPLQDVVYYRIDAIHSKHFCIGDEVLLLLDQQQARGLLLLKIAPGQQQQEAQFGIRLFPPVAAEFSQPQSQNIQLQRLSYQAGDWWRLNCQTHLQVAMLATFS